MFLLISYNVVITISDTQVTTAGTSTWGTGTGGATREARRLTTEGATGAPTTGAVPRTPMENTDLTSLDYTSKSCYFIYGTTKRFAEVEKFRILYFKIISSCSGVFLLTVVAIIKFQYCRFSITVVNLSMAGVKGWGMYEMISYEARRACKLKLRGLPSSLPTFRENGVLVT